MVDPISSFRDTLPTLLYTAAQSRQLDRLAQQLPGIDGSVLMRRAGSAAFDVLRSHWPQARRLLIFCGGGNNGGDGYVLAELAQRAGFSVTLVALVAAEQLRGEALVACRNAVAAGVEPLPFAAERLVDTQHDLLVDALLGTGLSGEPRAEYRAVIDWINASALPVLALDLPSGLDADTGRVWGAAVRADLTIAFIAAKRGMLTGAGPDHCGLLGFADLELPGALHQKLESEAVLRLTSTLLPQWLPRRPRSAHKGMFGHLLIIGGNHGYGGAVSIAAEAALRAGAGLVTIATRGAHLSALLARRPEAMVRAVESGQDLEPLLALPTVILLGPGLGQDAWAEQMVQRVLGSDLPLVVDADGLNLLARRATPVHRENWILTPHPGEAARLLGCDSREVEADRFAAVQQLAERHGGVALLKGAGTLVASAAVGGGIALCAAGNPGMASGGMGDLLSGLIAALLAQQLSLVDAARAGVLLHAMAGDEAAGGNERGLLATDLLAPLRRWVNPL
ncbi:MAG: NAD(P)H-hydrate dehydratase [Pseudomonadales bacterium]|jgi:hydroxyethylthiazole kinase-like uncharacterized protein yjeF|nr:NAD(P)H-hydrate dehydratase [Pseudomonadales bacterium]HMU90582.1 NAD(P)H-hydrate dehydratase [Pseudomonadales bacterium]HMW14114.1 NAD(P)H-hydrate dehydratase [Pseudomonadales bacterium]HMW83437.1 NAD(P)H-hydrate dehydratase [Pseudomonadales bacterium]HMZ92029.1 NAD(P)H-hydrate dehydratase [Pseudomonadales bacterium]